MVPSVSALASASLLLTSSLVAAGTIYLPTGDNLVAYRRAAIEPDVGLFSRDFIEEDFDLLARDAFDVDDEIAGQILFRRSPVGSRSSSPAPRPASPAKFTPENVPIRPPSPNKGALYSHTQGAGANLNRDELKQKIHDSGHSHIGDALNDPHYGKLDNPHNPKTFLENDPNLSARKKNAINKDRWDTVSQRYAHELSGHVPVHTTGSGPFHPNSVYERKEKDEVQRPGGPATHMSRFPADSNTVHEGDLFDRRPSSPSGSRSSSRERTRRDVEDYLWTLDLQRREAMLLLASFDDEVELFY